MYETIIPIAFNFGTLAGSFVLGSLYEDIEIGETAWVNNVKLNVKKYNLFYSAVIVVACLIAMSFMRINIPVYFLLSMICGLFLGGTYNMFIGNEVVKIVGKKKKNVNYLSTLSMMFNNIVTGVSEVVIGYVLNSSASNGK